MKKQMLLAAVGLMSVALLAGCGKQADTDQSAENEAEISTVEVEEVTEDPNHPGEARSDLTGEWIDAEIASQRPFAIMIGNTKVATPQYGISQADVVYESPVEGSETRLMAIFQDYQSVEKIRSIRSCRLYYIDWALEFDAIYGHFGQSYLAEDMLASDVVDNLSGLDGSLTDVMYFRDSDQKAPHNAYTTGEGISAGIATKGYETAHREDYVSHYLFNEDDENEIQLTDGQDAAVVKPGYFVDKPWFVYNTETGLYERYQYGEAHMDANNNEQVAVKNILLQVCEWSVADEDAGYLDVETVGSGDGYYVTNGKVIPVTWTKESQTAPTQYFDADGNQITMNQGKTWVCIIEDTYADRVTFYASQEEYESAQ